MLATLSIRDIVLIDRLDIEFEPGLVVLSGETGAGKSIVLDALALALGGRGDAGLVRHGAEFGSVTAAFSGTSGRLTSILEEHGLKAEDEIVLRRTQYADGRTRAYVNDEPVSARLMRGIGQAAVEIHGQHDERALLDPDAHLFLLDAFAELTDLRTEISEAFDAMRRAESDLADHEADLAKAAADADYLRHALDELNLLAPEPDEEQSLADERQLMIEGERMAEDLAAAHAALGGEGGAQSALARALAALERADSRASGTLAAVLEAASRADTELNDAFAALEAVMARLDADPGRLDSVEERLFSLRAAARKHGTTVDGLPELREALARRLEALEGGEERLQRLKLAFEEAAASYRSCADRLGEQRREAATRLDGAIEAELKPLKLEAARFVTHVESIELDRASRSGLDRVEFTIAANPGTPPGPLRKVASGGELSRVMLALKVVLAGLGSAPTLVFDEIDSGVGGAVADAVGERLQRLGRDIQVLVVTHSPQVAARGDDHFLIEKRPDTEGDRDTAVRTGVHRLSGESRREEIARMLAGAKVTDEARAAADTLLGVAG